MLSVNSRTHFKSPKHLVLQHFVFLKFYVTCVLKHSHVYFILVSGFKIHTG